MRVSLRRSVQLICAIAILQVVVYYWSIKRPRKVRPKLPPHRHLDRILGSEGTCSYQTCPDVKDGMLNVHLVPHSHIDVGWLKTVDQYYTGEDPEGQYITGCVRCTLNSTIHELQRDPRRRFIFVEMIYFSRYWNEISERERKVIRQLIKERRLELVNGGWVMSDAGITMYNDIIDQHTLGFDFIKETFGPCAQTRTAWHVDQFGHSREHASLFAQMGYDSIFVGRIDFQDLAERKKNKNLEFIWDTSPKNLKEKSTLFTQTTFDGYYAPPSYVFDGMNAAGPITGEREVYNFVRILQERARTFKTNHLLVPMGSDFGYMKAAKWFDNIDALIQKINAMHSKSLGMNLNLIYSSPSCYTYSVNKERQVFEVKHDDFHPYGISPGVYWTGYFTSRGGFKMHIKRASQILQSCKQLSIFAGLDSTFGKIDKLRGVLAVMQHHDAITGTQKKHVLNDYNKMLSEGINECETVMSLAYQHLWTIAEGRESTQPLPTPVFCHNLNISSCETSENSGQFMTTLYNPLSWSVETHVRIPVKHSKVEIIDESGYNVPNQMVPAPSGIKAIPERSSTADTEVVFSAQLPPMSMTSFKVKTGGGAAKPSLDSKTGSDVVIENEHLELTFSAKTGTLISVYNKDSKIRDFISQEFLYYEGQQNGVRASGAYVFIPRNVPPKRVGMEAEATIKVVKGKIVQEVHQTFCSWVSQVVRLYKGARYAEFQWVVGPIDDSKEIVSRFTSDVKNGNTFYTDSNGREMMKRVRDTRETWDYKAADNVSGNYYPVTSKILIKDHVRNVQLTVLPDRPQGGSSLRSGSIELMVHRKLLLDDGLGVGEPLNDQGVDQKGIIFTGKHYLCLDTIDKSALLTKHLALQVHMAPVIMFTPLNSNDLHSLKQQTFLSSTTLPDNVQVLTLDRISRNDSSLFLLRLEHVFEVEEDPVLSSPVEISLELLFKPFDIMSAEETTLGGNFRPLDVTRLEWKTTDGPTVSNIESSDYHPNMEPPFRIKLQPMEIRTFRVQVSRDS